MTGKDVQAQCLCGKVKLKFKLQNESFDACHCAMCRMWGGGPLMTVHGGTDLAIEGRDVLKVYNSSEWAERAFCGECGTHIFYRLKGPQLHFVPVGLLENAEELRFNMQIYIDKKPSAYNFAEKTQTMTEAQVIAAFGS